MQGPRAARTPANARDGRNVIRSRKPGCPPSAKMTMPKEHLERTLSMNAAEGTDPERTPVRRPDGAMGASRFQAPAARKARRGKLRSRKAGSSRAQSWRGATAS